MGEWKDYDVCTNCALVKSGFYDHANDFSHTCSKCGNRSWETRVRIKWVRTTPFKLFRLSTWDAYKRVVLLNGDTKDFTEWFDQEIKTPQVERALGVDNL